MPESAPVLDRAALDRLDRIGGSAFVVEMIELFLQHSPERVARARAALRDGDLPGVFRAAHSLKSTAANLGARALQRAAEVVEERAAAGEAAVIPALLDALEGEYRQAGRRLETERDRRRST